MPGTPKRHAWGERHPERYSRPPETERAARVVEAMHQHGVLTQAQIETLFFGGKKSSRASTLLEQLFHHSILNRRVFSKNHPMYYTIGEAAPDYLKEKLGLTGVKYSPHKYRGEHHWFSHSEEVAWVRIALTIDCQKNGLLLKCLGEKELRLQYIPTDKREKPITKYLDEYFIVSDPLNRFPGLHLPFEMDRGTHYLDTFGEKIVACLDYMKGKTHREKYSTGSLRILTVTSKGHIRLRNLKTKTESLGGKSRFWFATLDDVLTSSILFDPIWQIAGRGEEQTHLITMKENGATA